MKMHDEFLKMVKTQDTELASQVEKMKNTPLDQKAPHIVETNPRLLPSLENKSLPTDQATPLSNAGWLFLINLTPSGQALSEADKRRPFPSW